MCGFGTMGSGSVVRSLPGQTREWLKTLGVRPSKALGQNFLVDRNILDILMRTAEPDPHDAVLEAGPGLGTLTERLLAAYGAVTAVEKDARLAAFLNERYADEGRLCLLQGDMLAMDTDALLAGESAGSPCLTRVVSNLPYAAGTRMLVNLVLSRAAPRSVTVTLQREVAQRLVAPPGSREYGTVSVWVRIRYDARIVKHVPPACFWPKPDVVSSIVDLRMREEGARDMATIRRVRELSKRAFQQRRKQVIVALCRNDGKRLERDRYAAALRYAGAKDADRAENLAPEQWVALARALGEGGG